METRIEKHRRLLLKAKGNPTEVKKVISEIGKTRAGLILCRNMGEEIDEFLGRRPELKEFFDWTESIVLSPKYDLVSCN